MSKIALVDDDRNILTSVSMTLEAEGFEVETYNDGQAALDAFNKKLPDMAVLDIKMPGLDGIDVLKDIKNNYQNIRVIMLTNYDFEQYRRQCMQLGADYFFNKTLEFEKVVNVLIE